MVSKFMTSLFCVCLLVIRSNECHQILRGKRSPENAWMYGELVHRTDGSQLSHPQQSNNKNTFEIIVLEAPSGNESPTNRNDPAKPQVPISLQASDAVQLLSLLYDGKQYENGLQEKIPQQNFYTTQPKEEPKYAPPYDNNEQLHKSELPHQDMGLKSEGPPDKERDPPPHDIDAPPQFYNWGPPTRPPPPHPHHPPPSHHPLSPHNWNPPPHPPPDDRRGHSTSELPPPPPPENGWGHERRDPHAGGPPGGRGPPRPPPPPDDKWGHDARDPPPPPTPENGWGRERRDPPPHAGGPPGGRGPSHLPPPPDDKWGHDINDPPPHAGGPPGGRGPPHPPTPPPPPPDDKWGRDTGDSPPPPPPENGWDRERRDPPPHARGPPGGRGPPPHARGRGPPPHARGPPHRGWESMAEINRKRFDEPNIQEELPAQKEKAINKIDLKDTVSNDSSAVYDRFQGSGVPLTSSKGTHKNIEQSRPQPHLFQVEPVTPES